MTSMATLTSFIGWCTVINAVFLIVFMLFFAIVDKSEDGFVVKLMSSIFGNTRDDILTTFFRIFQQYRLLFIFFNLTPYIALKAMA